MSTIQDHVMTTTEVAGQQQRRRHHLHPQSSVVCSDVMTSSQSDSRRYSCPDPTITHGSIVASLGLDASSGRAALSNLRQRGSFPDTDRVSRYPTTSDGVNDGVVNIDEATSHKWRTEDRECEVRSGETELPDLAAALVLIQRYIDNMVVGKSIISS